MNSLDELIAYIENRLPSVEGLWTNLCQTGDSYVVIGEDVGTDGPDIINPKIPGTVQSGRVRKSFPDEASALMGAKIHFDLYANGRNGILYWRSPPRLSSDENRWFVYLRLVISDKSVIYPDLETLNAARGKTNLVAA